MRTLSVKSLLIHWVILACFICCFDTAMSPVAGDYSSDGWPTSTPEEQGMRSGKLSDMLEEINEAGYAIESVTVIRNGCIVLDAYFHPYKRP